MNIKTAFIEITTVKIYLLSLRQEWDLFLEIVKEFIIKPHLTVIYVGLLRENFSRALSESWNIYGTQPKIHNVICYKQRPHTRTLFTIIVIFTSFFLQKKSNAYWNTLLYKKVIFNKYYLNEWYRWKLYLEKNIDFLTTVNLR